MLQKITSSHGQPLFDAAATRRIEEQAASTLPPHTLMHRAGLAVARLSLALAPHAKCIWIACGPGNNGGDGFTAALHLHQWGKQVTVTCIEPGSKGLPADAAAARRRAEAAGVRFAAQPPPHFDFCIDALLGPGRTAALPGKGRTAALPEEPDGAAHPRPGTAQMLAWLEIMRASFAPRLAVDVPTGLDGDAGTLGRELAGTLAEVSGQDAPRMKNPSSSQKESEGAMYSGAACARITLSRAVFTLSLLTLKPGLLTAQGKDVAGEVWFDSLDVSPVGEPPSATMLGADGVAPVGRLHRLSAAHSAHKGVFGDVAVVGGHSAGNSHMVGAALLAAQAALHAGAGRVFVSLPEQDPEQNSEQKSRNVPGQSRILTVDTFQPELMFRNIEALDLATCTVVCGCGGGSSVKAVLPHILRMARQLVLDADALNAIAADAALVKLLKARSSVGVTPLGAAKTILTPHPLEAARLLGTTAATVQSDRLGAARQLAEMTGAVVVLKGSGTVICTPNYADDADDASYAGISRFTSCINSTGNPLLATAGTGDVLAGMVGAQLAHGLPAFDAACSAVFAHGKIADHWEQTHPGKALTASRLARAI